MMRKLLVLLALLLLVGTVSANAFSAWSASGDSWVATNATHTLRMWNATGAHVWPTDGNTSYVDYLVVAGGGATGRSGAGNAGAGGGGAGGMLNGTGYPVSGTINIVVGDGGTGSSTEKVKGTDGQNSSLANTTPTNGLNARGGGAGGVGSTSGGQPEINGNAGGSGGGGGYPSGSAGGAGTAGQGNAGAACNGGSCIKGGGGGGADGAASAMAGGVGRVSGITGSLITYATGGNANDTSTIGAPGTDGLGNGAVGAYSPGVGSDGGSGVVIISYLTSGAGTPISASFTQSPNPSTPGQSVSFTDTSTGTPTTWNWTFGDIGGSNTSTSQNPTHTYASVGTYTVALNVTNATGGYSRTTNTQTVNNGTGFTYQDVYQTAVYNQTFVITDSLTGYPIPVVTITDELGNTYTTTTGTGYLSQQAGVHVAYFTAAGYANKALSYIVDSDSVHQIQMTASSSTIKQQSIWYTPKQISVTVVYYYPAGKKIPAAPINLRAIGSSLQDNVQMQTVYGINPDAANQMLNGTLIMNSNTSMDGVAVFTVLASINYLANVTDPATGKVWYATINPGLDPYTIWVGDKPNAVNNTEIDALNQTRLWAVKTDVGNWTLNMQYRDLTGRTTDVRFIVKSASNLTEVYNVSLGNPGTSLVVANKTYRNIIGDAYYYYWVATRV